MGDVFNLEPKSTPVGLSRYDVPERRGTKHFLGILWQKLKDLEFWKIDG